MRTNVLCLIIGILAGLLPSLYQIRETRVSREPPQLTLIHLRAILQMRDPENPAPTTDALRYVDGFNELERAYVEHFGESRFDANSVDRTLQLLKAPDLTLREAADRLKD